MCLHGYPDTAWTWRFLGPYLAGRGQRVVAPFMRGYAPTDLAPDGGYQVGALARDAIEAHAALGGDARALLIGHDWGAIAAYCAASHSPHRFRRVVTMAVPPPATVFAPLMSPRGLAGDLPTALGQLRLSWYMLFQQLPVISERRLGQLIPKLWADWSPGFDARQDLDHVFAALDSPRRRTAALRYYRALAQPWYRLAKYAPEQAHWMRIPEQPVLLLQGQKDGCIQPVFAERARDALTPSSAVEVVPDAGHFLQLERPDLINQLIGRFIAAG
ncbi:MAG: alpha/beta hydrolase [Actinomycetota bacterium]|nr:alpha/beta hydrolase [Actinomycetota bacterium]